MSLSDNLSDRTNNRKWTENKFKCGEAKPELLDDWDQRLVVTTLLVNEEGSRLSLDQVAETDQVGGDWGPYTSPLFMSTLFFSCFVKTARFCWRLIQMIRIF